MASGEGDKGEEQRLQASLTIRVDAVFIMELSQSDKGLLILPKSVNKAPASFIDFQMVRRYFPKRGHL